MRLLLPLRTVLVPPCCSRRAPLALAAAPDTPVAVPNAGFETAGRRRPALGLVPRRPGAGRGDRAPRGRRARRRGAIELGADAPASLTVRSEPVDLRVGHVYRLSAWVKTQGAVADPLARYPTAVAATISMASFPFTNHSAAVGGTRDWTRVETTFVATAASDRVELQLGRNGTATGRACSTT